MQITEFRCPLGGVLQAVQFADGVAAIRFLAERFTILEDRGLNLVERYGPTVGPPRGARRFQLVRSEDVSGSSGTGVVATGMEFADGSCVMRWVRPPCSTACYASAADLLRIHDHGGRSVLQYLDPPELPAPPPPGLWPPLGSAS